jgi:hypothetical protein
MSQPFILKLSDSVTTIDFLGLSYRVADGGFDISLPRVRREFAAQREGFYVPTISAYEYRECTLRFDVRGATRSAVLDNFGKIERILRNIAARSRHTSAGLRGELQYAWEGATNVTFFEVYGGDIRFPGDVLSVAKVHKITDGKYVLPDVEITLFLSGMGYGVSLYSNTLTEVPLFNPNVGVKSTGGVKVQNSGTHFTGGAHQPLYNYVEIDGVDLPGNQPLITRIQLASNTPYSAWNVLYMGLKTSPFPTKLVFEDSELVDGFGTPVNNNTASGGTYRSSTWAGSTPFYNPFASFAWSVVNSSAGLHMVFLDLYSQAPAHFQFATGVDDYVSYGIRYQGEYVQMISTALRSIPLGTLQLPPTDLDVVNYGTLNPNLWMGLWVAGSSGGTLEFDKASLLPITNGLRMWRSRVSALTGTLIDDGWRGHEYLLNSSVVTTPFYGMLDNLKLEPGITQRIYFKSVGSQTSEAERLRAFMARVFVVPTYLALAL